MKKNDLVSLTIESVTLEGNGVGHYEGMAVFVPFTAVGDELIVRIVKLQKNYAFGIIDTLVSPGEGRISPDCQVFGKCGGCDFRHLDYSAECALKQEAVTQVLRRIGGVEDPNVLPIVGGVKTEGFRNKAQYPAVALPDGGVGFGFFAKRSHRVIPVRGCRLQNELFDRAIDIVARWACENNISVYDEKSRKGLLRHIFLRYAEKTGQLMVMPVINGAVPSSASLLADTLVAEMGDFFHTLVFNINKKDTNVILGNRCVTVWGEGFITDIVCGVKLRISPHAFSQTNRDMAELMYQKAASYLPEKTDVLVDLYCGVGAIGLSMAHKTRRLIGVEIVPQAVEDARVNARLNQIENAEFICADAAKAAEQLKKERLSADCVILDPPRKGCEESLLHTVANDFAPQRIIYISCNPGTLARDTKVLESLGYKLIEATPYDLFPRTAHVETVALFSRQTDVHEMKLNSSPFEMIKGGEKTIELRLYDEKRRQVKVGDKIIFTNTATGETLNTTVSKLHRFDSFEELYKTLPLLKCGYTAESVDNAGPDDMKKYYSEAQQKKYGVVGIELCLD